MGDFFAVVQRVMQQVEEERQSIVRGGSGGRRHHVPPKESITGGKTVFEHMRDADETSVSFSDLLRKVLSAIILSWPFLIFHAILLTLPIAMIAIGGSNYNQCTAEDLLPLWLIVFGIVSLFCLVIQLRNLSGLRHMATGDNDSDPGHSSSMHVSGTEAENGDENIQGAKYFNIFMLIFLLGWFGWGNYLVFRIYPPKYTMPSQPPFQYCTQTIYVFAFVLIIAVHSFLILFLLLLMLVACIWQRKSSEYDDINGR
ncbi:transmembrane protein 272-like isoform X2 [Convolutriloba macropyga]|uniref:transmembrane protein 272-like isoform X2 n=1 Tax=Convolutriloba macropyga TaxID=536237 RepID=UPI003F51BF44